MNQQDLYSLISNTFGVEQAEIHDDSDFVEDFNCEHTDIVEFHLQLQDLFKGELNQEELDQIQTVEDLTDLLEDHNILEEI